MPEARTPRYLHRSHREVMFGFSLIDFMVYSRSSGLPVGFELDQVFLRQCAQHKACRKLAHLLCRGIWVKHDVW